MGLGVSILERRDGDGRKKAIRRDQEVHRFGVWKNAAVTCDARDVGAAQPGKQRGAISFSAYLELVQISMLPRRIGAFGHRLLQSRGEGRLVADPPDGEIKDTSRPVREFRPEVLAAAREARATSRCSAQRPKDAQSRT